MSLRHILDFPFSCMQHCTRLEYLVAAAGDLLGSYCRIACSSALNGLVHKRALDQDCIFGSRYLPKFSVSQKLER